MPESMITGIIILLMMGFGFFIGWQSRQIALEWGHDCMPHDPKYCTRQVDPSHDD